MPWRTERGVNCGILQRFVHTEAAPTIGQQLLGPQRPQRDSKVKPSHDLEAMEWGSSVGPQPQAGKKTWGTVTLVDPGTPTSGVAVGENCTKSVEFRACKDGDSMIWWVC